MTAVVAEAYVLGVSTRRVEDLVRAMGVDGISRTQVYELARSLDGMVEAFRNRPLDAAPYPYVWLDALTQRCREDGRVVNVATVIATGVNADGHREILGVDVFTSEDGTAWTNFLRGLVARGLDGVRLVISDSHLGAEGGDRGGAAGRRLAAVPGHFMWNLLSRVPKSAQDLVATLVRSIFAQPDQQAAWERHGQVVQQLEQRFPSSGV